MIKLSRCWNPWNGSLNACESLRPSQWRWTRSGSILLKIKPSLWIWRSCSRLMRHWGSEATKWLHDRKEQTRTFLPKVYYFMLVVLFPCFCFLMQCSQKVYNLKRALVWLIRANTINSAIKGEQSLSKSLIILLSQHVFSFLKSLALDLNWSFVSDSLVHWTAKAFFQVWLY